MRASHLLLWSMRSRSCFSAYAWISVAVFLFLIIVLAFTCIPLYRKGFQVFMSYFFTNYSRICVVCDGCGIEETSFQRIVVSG
jgi:hypothetical protein